MKNQQSMVLKQVCRGMSVLLATLLSFAAFAQNTIESVTASVQGGVEIIRVDLTQELPTSPNGFSIHSPARIALDLLGVVNGLGRPTVDVNQGNVRSINVVQSGDRSRLVLNLKQTTNYKTEIRGKSLFVSLDPVAAPSGAVVAATVFSEDRNRDVLAIKDMDFRRGAEGAGRVIVDLANSQVGVDIKQQGQTLVVEFLKSSMPEGMRRRLDVSDFGTPVQSVTTFQTGDRVRMVIEPRGAWEHSAYQSDNQFVVEVRPQKVDSGKLAQGANFSGEKLSLNFQNIEVRALLQVIADFTNFNIVTSDTVGGSVTLRLKDVPWDQALDIILRAKNLGMRKVGSVLMIAPRDEINAKEKQELESTLAIQGLEPLRSISIQLNYAKVSDILVQLNQSNAGGPGGVQGQRFMSPRGSAFGEPRTNQLFITDIPSKLALIQEMVSKLDIPVRQVMIEARIVEAQDTFGRSLGVRLGGADLRGIQGGQAGYPVGGGSDRVAFAGTYDAMTATTTQSSGSLNNLNTTLVNLPAIGQGGYAPATFAMALFSNAANRFLNLELSAMEADGKGKIVASPRVVTADQAKALIEQGTEYPYQQATSSGATSTAFRKASLKLEVTPQITPEGNVILDVDVTKDSRGETTAQGIAINTKHVRTQVLVENGGTVVFGGIFELQEENDAQNLVVIFGRRQRRR